MIKLPKCVYYKNGAYYLVKSNKWHRLGKTLSEMYLSLSEITSLDGHNLDFYFCDYLKHETLDKAKSTQSAERYAMKNLLVSFGGMNPKAVKPKHVYEYHLLRSRVSQAGADREKALLSVVFTKLMMLGIVDVNPCFGVKKNVLKPRTRYVTDYEFNLVRSHASEAMKVAMDFALITGLRMGDILNLTQDNIKSDGLQVATTKTSRSLTFLWSDALRSCVDSALKLSDSSVYLVTNANGQKFTSSAFKSQWQRLQRKLVSIDGFARFQFKDLRKKAGVDSEENTTKLLGHYSQAVTDKHYEILPVKVVPNKPSSNSNR